MQSIINDILDALNHAEKTHPSIPSVMLDPITDPTPAQFEVQAKYAQKENDLAEAAGCHSWYGIDREEMAEKYSAKTIDELYEETIQCAALHLRFAKALKAGKIRIR